MSKGRTKYLQKYEKDRNRDITSDRNMQKSR